EPEPSPEVTPEPEPAPTEEPAEPVHPGVVTSLPTGSWVTVLASLPKDAVTADQAVQRAQQESRPGHQAIVIDTNSFTGLTPGYWAVVIPGADSRAASDAVCDAIGIPVSDHCYAREIKG
ncbi:MAG: hypothetical protein Q4F65_14720, partial [Propionibacteriaceae bacterium]|nr:hypothetical protein [Propionibacteriaceae bacterium]